VTNGYYSAYILICLSYARMIERNHCRFIDPKMSWAKSPYRYTGKGNFKRNRLTSWRMRNTRLPVFLSKGFDRAICHEINEFRCHIARSPCRLYLHAISNTTLSSRRTHIINYGHIRSNPWRPLQDTYS